MSKMLFLVVLMLATSMFVGCKESADPVDLKCTLKSDVCGLDGKTYSACEADEKNIVIQYQGACENPTKCAVASDCDAGFECGEFVNSNTRDLYCIPVEDECSSANDCAAGQVCIDGVCKLDCEPVTCEMYCEFGFKIDETGCEICQCNEVPNCLSNSDCPIGYECAMPRCEGERCLDAEGVCVRHECPDVMCDMFCEFGNKVDEFGCELCECNPSPDCQSNADCPQGYECLMMDCAVDENGNDVDCIGGNICVRHECNDVMCELYCENGFKVDEFGCEICECNEVPVECMSDEDCGIGFMCVYPNCGKGEKCIGEDGEYSGICVKREAECVTDADCDAGLQCMNGICINYFCPSDCSSDRECGEGFICQPVNCLTPEGISGTQCVPAEIHCNSYTPCPVGMECQFYDGCYLDETTGEIVCVDDGICVPVQNDICYSDLDCAAGQICFFLDYAETGTCIAQCEPVTCDLYCEFGFKVDENGCEICVCNEEPNCPSECLSDADCGEGFICEQIYCLTPDGIPGSQCVYNNGCEPVMCDLYCEFGFKVDETGCEICVCNERPMECGGFAGLPCPEGYECQYDQNIPDSMGVCVPVNTCPFECVEDFDCGLGYTCEAVRCITADGQTGSVCSPVIETCSYDSDCAANEVCINGICMEANQCPEIDCLLYCENGYVLDVNGCQTCECLPVTERCDSNQSCPAGQVCVNGVCSL